MKAILDPSSSKLGKNVTFLKIKLSDFELKLLQIEFYVSSLDFMQEVRKKLKNQFWENGLVT